MSDKNPITQAMRVGDWEFLASYIESGGNIDVHKGLRQFIAGIVRGTTRRSANRNPKLGTVRRQYAIAQAAFRGGVDWAMETFNVDRRTVQRAQKAYKHALEKDPDAIVNLWLYQRRYYHDTL
jgi:hypothetical protein